MGAVSTYLLHDVDKDMTSHLNKAFAQACIESGLFALIVGGTAGLLTAIGGFVFHLRGCFPRAKLGFFLGVGVAFFQYPWDLSTRMMFPKVADLSLSIYLAAAIVFCTFVLLRAAFKEKKMLDAATAFRSV